MLQCYMPDNFLAAALSSWTSVISIGLPASLLGLKKKKSLITVIICIIKVHATSRQVKKRARSHPWLMTLKWSMCTSLMMSKSSHEMETMSHTSLCLVYHRPPVVMDHGKAGNRYSALFSPGRFCFLLYHAPSSGDFSSAISSSSSSNTSSAAKERKGKKGGIFFLSLSFFFPKHNHAFWKMSLTCFADPLQVSSELSLNLLLPAKL